MPAPVSASTPTIPREGLKSYTPPVPHYKVITNKKPISKFPNPQRELEVNYWFITFASGTRAYARADARVKTDNPIIWGVYPSGLTS